jgi:hypothetical protein
MIAMQYSFVLPADYDMAIIDRRIAERGRFTDCFPGLRFKAYLSSRKQADGENRYAPFYLWESPEAMNMFLTGPGFEAVSQSFGWPSVQSWIVWHAELTPRLHAARFATRELLPVLPYAGLAEMQAAEARRAERALKEHGALASVAAFEPGSWTLVQFALWEHDPGVATGCDRYEVGHVSTANAA